MKKIIFFFLIFKLSPLSSMCLEKNKYKFNIDNLIQQTLEASTFDQLFDLISLQTKFAIYLTQCISFDNYVEHKKEVSPIDDSFLQPKVTSWQEWNDFQKKDGREFANYKSKVLPCFNFYQGNREAISSNLDTYIKKIEVELRIKYNHNLFKNGYINIKRTWFDLLITNLEKINHSLRNEISNSIPHLHALLINHFINDLTVTPIIEADLEKDGELIFCKKILQINFLGFNNIFSLNKQYQMDSTQDKEPIIPTELNIATKKFLYDKYKIHAQCIKFFDGIELD